MRIAIQLAAMGAMLWFAGPASGATSELATVPAEAVVKVKDDDYAKAREVAILKAFNFATNLAVRGLISPSEILMKKDIIENQIARRGQEFVKSYKFLEETIDSTRGYLHVRLQVTLFLEKIRSEIKYAGVRAKKRKLPKLLMVIDEKTIGFFSGGNIFHLKSLSEETLAQYFQDRGYLVVSRKNIQAQKMENKALEAIKINNRAIVELAYAMEVDLVLFGKTKVDARRSFGKEKIEATLEVTIYAGENGKEIMAKRSAYFGEYEEALAGSLDAIRSATLIVAGELGLAIPRIWQRVNENE